MLAMSLDLLLGYTGLASLGHAAYLGVGAYSVGVLTTQYGANFWATLAVGVCLAIVVAAVFGLVALRATGVYFLMITLSLGMVVWGLAQRWVSLTQGDNGIAGIPRPDLGLPWTFATSTSFYYLVLVGFLVAGSILGIIVRSPFGQSLVGIRESASRMQTLGYHVWLHKYIAYVIAGAFGGFAGVFWAYYNGFVSPGRHGVGHLCGDPAHGGPRRARHSTRAGSGSRDDCPAEKSGERLHGALALDSGRHLCADDHLRARGDCRGDQAGAERQQD